MFTARSLLRTIKCSELMINACLRNDVTLKSSSCMKGFIFKQKTQLRPYCTPKLESANASDNSNYEVPNLDEITNGDKDLEYRLKVLMLEVEVLRQEGKIVPPLTDIKPHHWKDMLKLGTRSARRKYLEFLFKVGRKKENEKLKKESKRQQRLESGYEPKKAKTFEEFAQTYDLQHNNIFLRIYETTINQMYNNRLVQAMKFGQKIVVDCGYSNNMTDRENKNCAKQLMLLFAENRAHDDPFDLHYCNADKQSVLMESLHRHVATMYEPWFPLNIHETSYLDIFPKQQLVYLTPHCKEEMVEYDHDATYIIGGIVDKVNNEPLSLAKAKKEGLRMMKLPLDRYLQWGSGSGKSLTLNQVVAILLDVKSTGDWNYSLRHVPRRKLMDHSAVSAVEKSSVSLRYDRRQNFRKAWKPKSIQLDTLSFDDLKGKSQPKQKKDVIKDIFTN